MYLIAVVAILFMPAFLLCRHHCPRCCLLVLVFPAVDGIPAVAEIPNVAGIPAVAEITVLLAILLLLVHFCS
jgi:hypothetical protein